MFRFVKKMYIRLLSLCAIGSFCELLVSNSKGQHFLISNLIKQVICKKSKCHINTFSLVIVFLLLVIIIFIRCYYHYTRDWIKKHM